MSRDIIFGIHSITAAIGNDERRHFTLYSTDETWKKLKSEYVNLKDQLNSIEVKMLSPHNIQEEGKKQAREMGHEVQRIPGGAFLLCDKLIERDFNWLRDGIKNNQIRRFLCLDQITDVHNAAAILRTASFFGVDALIVSQKGDFGTSPNFFRIASGSTEYVPIVKVNNLSRVLTNMQEWGVTCLGFSEKADSNIELNEASLCLVIGNEEKGLSHAVLRTLKHQVALTSQGEIKSLNASVAAAIAMEKFFKS